MEKELKSGKPDLDNNQPISPYRETGIRLYSVHLRCLRDVIHCHITITPPSIQSTTIHTLFHAWGSRMADHLSPNILFFMGFPGGSDGKESTCNVGDLGSIPGLGRSPGGGHGNPLQYSCLENPHGQRSPGGYNPWGRRVGHDWVTKYTHSLLWGLPRLYWW